MDMRTHVEDIVESRRVYRLALGGTVDGENTRSPVGYQVYDQAFEPNLYVRMENIGGAPVKNPWLIANGKDWRTVASIVNGVVTEEMGDAEKALALWTFQRHRRFHASPYDRDNGNAVKMLNVYGYGLCGDDSYALADLWRQAGLRVRAGRPIGHSTTEVFYDGMWHLLDGDEHVICLMRDNETIAGEEEIVRDHDLMKRTHVYGVLKPDDRQTDEFSAALFPFDGEREEKKGVYPAHTMGLTLRPCEALEWRWDGRGKFHGRENMGSWRNAWTRICNGVLCYAPDVRSDAWRFGAVEMANVAEAGALRGLGGPASATFEVKSPYAMVGGRIQGVFRRDGFDVRTALFVSFDREKWTEVWTAGDLGEVMADVCIDRFFPHEGEVRYGYFVRVDFQGEGVASLILETDLQMAPLSLPGLRLGDNEMVYVDDSETRQVRISHGWRERSDWVVPAAPGAPIFPRDGADVEGSQIIFEWQGGEGISDYHFQLSARADMKYVLSPNFEKLISRTAQAGLARYEMPYVGLLNPGQAYYWRVRAKNRQGVWSEWSAVWSFVPQAPGVPLDVMADRSGLTWRANPQGRRPVHFLVYGSDERGFTASDVPYPVLVEKNRTATFPANVIGEVESARFSFAPGDKIYAFYRVVAVDGNGNRSGPSDLAEAPRPAIWSAPVTEASAGQVYRYAAEAVRSIGDLRTVTIDGNPYNPAFRDADELAFELVEGPGWLRVNRLTGEVTGRPTGAGAFEVVIKAVRKQGGEDVQRFVLRVDGKGKG